MTSGWPASTHAHPLCLLAELPRPPLPPLPSPPPRFLQCSGPKPSGCRVITAGCLERGRTPRSGCQGAYHGSGRKVTPTLVWWEREERLVHPGVKETFQSSPNQEARGGSCERHVAVTTKEKEGGAA